MNWHRFIIQFRTRFIKDRFRKFWENTAVPALRESLPGITDREIEEMWEGAMHEELEKEFTKDAYPSETNTEWKN